MFIDISDKELTAIECALFTATRLRRLALQAARSYHRDAMRFKALPDFQHFAHAMRTQKRRHLETAHALKEQEATLAATYNRMLLKELDA